MKDYKKILEGVVNIINTTKKSDIGFANICTYIGENCPELKDSKESEDERIKKEIARFIRMEVDDEIVGNKWLAWLEKQGESDEPKFKVWDFIVNDYCMGRVVEITNDAYLLDTEQGIPFSCHSTRLWDITKDAKDGDVLYSPCCKLLWIYKDEKTCHVGFNLNYNSGGIVINKPVCIPTDVQPATKEQRDLLFKKMHEAGYEWDAENKELKKVEQKPIEEYNITGISSKHADGKLGEMIKNMEYVNKVEPKFHEGEWVTNGDDTWKIVEVKPLDYILQSQDGNIVGDTIFFVDKQFHSFTVEDAKAGDVLACNEEILLFKSYKSYSVQGRISLYCWYNGQTNHFHSKEAVDILLTTRNKICPATKEQRDTLMKAMADAGYTFDFEKKELKKIGQKSYGQRKECVDCQFNYAGECKGSCAMKRDGQKPAWSENDEDMKYSIIDILTKQGFQTQVNWLKSLKDRYTWKPSDEQMKVLDEAIAICSERYCGTAYRLDNLRQDLKRLKGK